MTTPRIRVMIVDDHAVVREGYRRLLERQRDIEVVAEADDGTSAYIQYRAMAPDVVIMDISMPGRGGIDAVRQIRMVDSGARILVFSVHATAGYAVQAIRAGARGYITKSSAADLLVSAVRSVYANKVTLCPEISKALALSHLNSQESSVEQLSAREFEILRMIVDAKSTDEIAGILNLTSKTISNYHYAIRSKLNVKSDIELFHLCMRYGLVAPLSIADEAVEN